MYVTYFPVLCDIAIMQEQTIAIMLVEMVMKIRFVESVTESHSTAAKTGIKSVAIPKIGRKKKMPAKPSVDLKSPKAVADCELIIAI